MTTLVLAIEAPYWQDVLLAAEKRGLKISHAVVQFRDTPAPNHYFDASKPIQIDGKKFYRIETLSKLIEADFGKNYAVLDAKTIATFEKYERDFYILTDRFSYFPRSYRYRKRLFRENLRYWLAFYQQNKITSVLSGCTPHNISDYMAFITAKELGLTTLLAAHTMINDHILIRHDYSGYEKVPASFMLGATEAELKAAISQALLERAMGESKVLNYVIQKNDAVSGAKNVAKAKKKIDKEKLGVFADRFKRFVLTTPKFKTALALNGVYSPKIRRLIRLYEIPRHKYLQRKHDELAITPDLNCKYIYFAMHLQPERTSTPEAELFEDHLLAIDILAKSLPSGWKLYIKENPRQYNKINLLKGRHQRDISDYQDYLKLPNVHLISQKIPSKDVLKNAQVVSTLSGSVGWEALKAGRPCIIFANAWYSACESIHRIENVDEAKSAIQNCLESTPEKVRINILRYLAYMQPHFNIGNMGTKAYIKAASFPYSDHVEKLAERICQEFNAKAKPTKLPQAV